MANENAALLQVTKQAEAMAQVDDQCERGYAHLGWLLLEVTDMGYWKVRYPTFHEYLESVSQVSKKSPSQLKVYRDTVRDLVDTFTADQLETIGITKAMKVRKAKEYALVIPVAVREAALDPKVTVRELHKLISTTLKFPEEPGDWMSLDCEFMVSPEQRALLEQAIDVARKTEPLTKDSISKSAQMLDVMTKFAQEFLGAHNGDGQ